MRHGSMVGLLVVAVLWLAGTCPISYAAAVTQVLVDGDSGDWLPYPVIMTDPAGDNIDGGFDISQVRAFTNDRYLYVLIETYGTRTDYEQLDILVLNGERMFRLGCFPEEGGSVHLDEVTDAGSINLGMVAYSECAAGESVEVKLPLATLGTSVSSLTLVTVRPMGGEPGVDWHPVDYTDSAQVPVVDETDPFTETPAAAAVCDPNLIAPASVGSLPPVSAMLPDGFEAEWFVAPAAFNMPQDVLVAPDGDLLVQSVRSQKLFHVAGDGTVSTVASPVKGYLGTIDAAGNVYLYSQPSYVITKVTPTGEVSTVIESTALQTPLDGGFGLGPDGNLYVSVNREGPSPLVRVTPAGGLTTLAADFPRLAAMRTAPDGRFLVATSDGGVVVHELSLDDLSLTPLGSLPPHEQLSPAGMTVDDSGNIYLATGARASYGKIYRIDPAGHRALVAMVPENGLSGIEWLPQSQEIVGGQLRRGALIAMSVSDGSQREIVPGNFLVSPMGIAISPCGELAVSCDDGGMMALVDPAGTASWFFDYLSFTPPVSYVVFASDGTLYTSEATPTFRPGRVAMVSPGGSLETYVDADAPSGLARRPDGTLIVSETGTGRVTECRPDGSQTALASGLEFPTALALDNEGRLFAVTGNGGGTLDPVNNPWPCAGDTVLRIASNGQATTLTTDLWVSAIAVSSAGDLVASAKGGKELVTISPDGTEHDFASGLDCVMGLAFDLAGNLYACEANLNGIIRIAGFPQGTLSGQVAATSGLPIPGAQIQVACEQPAVAGQIVTTPADGRFTLPIAPHSCTVTITAVGYDAAGFSNVVVEANQETVLDVHLTDSSPPTPSPMTWSAPPHAMTGTAVEMMASVAVDPSGVEYYFEETTGHPGAASSGWQDSPTYVNAGVSGPTECCYRVKARDKSADQNETGWSDAVCATVTGSTAAVFRVTSAGAVGADGPFSGAGFLSGSADMAERVPVSELVEPGDILELDTARPGSYRPAWTPCSPLVAGVVSTQPGVLLGGSDPDEGTALLALSGIVPVKVTDEGGPIQAGDLLVSSSTPGYAMRWAGAGPCPCALVGKALEPMTDERGVIRVLLTAH